MVKCSLNSVELKALSVSASLKFLLAAENDILLSIDQAGSTSLQIAFPCVAEVYQNLLTFCAARYGLECCTTAEGGVTLKGVPSLPLLRYEDYLPGGLTRSEILSCLDIELSNTVKRLGEGENAIYSANSLDDYSEFSTETALDDVHGFGFYLTLDCGLSLASHGHLLEVRPYLDYSLEDALSELKEFSGWNELRFRPACPSDPREGGVLIFPTVQDVIDLLEKYEDEDSDDEGELLPFILRPIAPLSPVPCVEDSTLRKLREQHWNYVAEFWERFPATKNTVMIFNLYPTATLKEILAFVEEGTVVKAQFVEDESPLHRRRVFITFSTLEAARKALDLDGKSTKGRTLRVQVSPPYASELRRGRLINEVGKVPATSSPSSNGPSLSPSNSGVQQFPASTMHYKKEDETGAMTSTIGHAAPSSHSCSPEVKLEEGKGSNEKVPARNEKEAPKMMNQKIHGGEAASGVTAATFYTFPSGSLSSSSQTLMMSGPTATPSISSIPSGKPTTPLMNSMGSATAVSLLHSGETRKISLSPSMKVTAKEFVPQSAYRGEPPQYTPPPLTPGLMPLPPPPPPPPPPPAYEEAVISQQQQAPIVFLSPVPVTVLDPNMMAPLSTFMLPPNAMYEEMIVGASPMFGVPPPPPPPPFPAHLSPSLPPPPPPPR